MPLGVLHVRCHVMVIVTLVLIRIKNINHNTMIKIVLLYKYININDNMQHKNIFADSLIVSAVVPQQGKLYITTEFGKLTVEPLEICVIQVSHSITCARFTDGLFST